jgi:drug/metabolite transporter (DMT)-like permease
MSDLKKGSAVKGIFLALAAALAVSNVYIFSKAALKEVHIAQFGVYWFGLGIIWNLIYIFVFGKQRGLKKLSGNTWLVLLLIAVLEMFGTVLFFMAINKVENPAVVSFLANINPLLITTLGILMLHEKFNGTEFLGMIITLTGAVMISYKGGASLSKLFIPGTEYVWLSGIIYSFSSVIAKKNIAKIDPSFLAMARILLLFVLSLVMVLSLGLSFKIPVSAFKNVAIGSVLGPFLTALLGYLSMKYIEVSKASIVRSVRSLFVLTGAYIYFGSFPTQIQIIGGLFTISGVIFISLGKLKKRQN